MNSCMHLHWTMLPVLRLDERHVQGDEAHMALTMVSHINSAKVVLRHQTQVNLKDVNMAEWLLASVFIVCMQSGAALERRRPMQ